MGRLGGYALTRIPAEMFHVNAADRAWVDAPCVPPPLAAFLEPAKVGVGPRERTRNSAASRAGNDLPSLPAAPPA